MTEHSMQFIAYIAAGTVASVSFPPACLGRLWRHFHAERSSPTPILAGRSVGALIKKKLPPDPFLWLSCGVKPRRNKHSSPYERTFARYSLFQF